LTLPSSLRRAPNDPELSSPVSKPSGNPSIPLLGGGNLIFERHFDSTLEEEFKEKRNQLFNTEDETMNTEDLGIIDLDDDDSLCDNIDDENLPVLKNSYSK
jgi:hypothetical protein